MIGIIVGFVYLVLVSFLYRLFFRKSRHPKIWVVICMLFSLVLGCLFVSLYSDQVKEEIIKCVYIIIPLTLLDKLFEKTGDGQ